MRNRSLQTLIVAFGATAAGLSLTGHAWAATATAIGVSKYSGNCPATIPFKGTVSGKPGTDVTYAFLFFDPGQGTVTTGASQTSTLGSDGKVAVSGKGVVTGSGNAWMQLALETPESAFSNTANFAVECAASSSSGSRSTAMSGGAAARTVATAVSTTPSYTNFVLEYSIWTGSDDLRSDSYVTALVSHLSPPYNQYSPNSHECLLKGDHQDTWDNNSFHMVPCPGVIANVASSAALIDIIKKSSFTISLNRFGGPWDIITKTEDNWNIQRVKVREYEPGSGKQPVCVLDVRGDPLKRLTGSEPTVTLSDYPSHC